MEESPMLWMGGLSDGMAGGTGGAGGPERRLELEHRNQIRELQHQVERLSLLNQALWELVRERLGMSDDDLERLAHEIDLRDGVADGKITATPVRCPSCNRVNSSRHPKCIYCGQYFEKPVFG